LAINPSLLNILCCPADYNGAACHGHLIDLGHGLRCKTCGLVYPIEDGIPVLLTDHAVRENDAVAGHQTNGGKK
jgi:uncharacterized protein YbaR (Trm112 family)